MPYTADISRLNPACFLFLLDLSGSMNLPLAGQQGQAKKDQASEAINGILNSITQRCSQGMDVLDYFHIGILGYNTDGARTPQIVSGFVDTTPDQPFLKVSEVTDIAVLEQRPIKQSDGAGNLVDVVLEVPVWVAPYAQYGTPMCAAFQAAHQALQGWVSQYPNSFPPIVINVSDGESGDGDPEAQAQALMNLSTNDGNTLLFNVHLSEVNAPAIKFPDSEDNLPQDIYARLMFRISSVLPESSREQAAILDQAVSEYSRGYVFNADMSALVQFLDIGTRAASNLQ